MVVLEYLWQVIKQSLYVLAVGFLPYLIFALLMQKISNAIRCRLASLLGLKGYVYITAPGVMIHELSHAFFCLLFRHKIVEMKLFSPEEDGTLGYVSHSCNPQNKFHRIGNFFIGTGPIWGGICVLWLVTMLFIPRDILVIELGVFEAFRSLIKFIFSAQFWCRWQSYCWLYLFLTISSHITLSKPDLEGAKDGAVFLIAAVFVLELLLGWSTSLTRTADSLLYSGFVCTSGILGLCLIITCFFAVVLAVFIRKKYKL